MYCCPRKRLRIFEGKACLLLRSSYIGNIHAMCLWSFSSSEQRAGKGKSMTTVLAIKNATVWLANCSESVVSTIQADRACRSDRWYRKMELIILPLATKTTGLKRWFQLSLNSPSYRLNVFEDAYRKPMVFAREFCESWITKIVFAFPFFVFSTSKLLNVCWSHFGCLPIFLVR